MTCAIVKPAREGPMSGCEWGLFMQVEWLARLMWVATATENVIKTLKLSVRLQCLYWILYIVKHIAICQALVAKKTKVATKLMKIVLFCSRFKLNEP